MLRPIFRLFRFLLSLPFLILLLVVLVLLRPEIIPSIPSEDTTSEEQEIEDENPSRDVEPATLTYEEEPAYEGATYFKRYEQIEGEWAYIAYPLEINLDELPTLIVYSHGSNTTITNNPEDPFMKDMQAYGEFFTENNFAFAASNEHGANWGSDEAIADIQNLIDWVNERYKIEPMVNMLAHSMGGLPTLHFAFQFPEQVNRIALLSPTTYIWGKDKYDAIASIQTKIWHGDEDVNIAWSVSKGFVDRGAEYGKKIELVTVEGATHWDVDTELKQEILDFYNE